MKYVNLIYVLAILLVVGSVMVVCQLFLRTIKSDRSRTFPMNFHKFVCKLLGFEVKINKNLPLKGPALIVANHISWLDIIILGSIVPLSFVAKKEVRSWFLVGWLAKLQNTIFIDRNRKKGAQEAGQKLAKRLQAGHIVVLFAEGTSSDGTRVLPFKSAVFGAIEQSALLKNKRNIPIIPLAQCCTEVRGINIGRIERNQMAWYGDMDLFPHMVDVIDKAPLKYTVSVGTEVYAADFPDRKMLTSALELEVRRRFHSIIHHRSLGVDEIRKPRTMTTNIDNAA